MRYARKLGLAGVPGAILDEGDIRRAVSFFAEEDRKAAQGVALGSMPSTSPEAACATCVTPAASGVRLSDRIAAKMFREMGAQPLADAAVDGKPSVLMQRAGALAAGISETLKLRTDKIAVLASLTSPMFAKAVDRTTLKLHGLKGDDRFASALTLSFLMGATDDHAKRDTFYSQAYRKAVQGMSEMLASTTDPALASRAQKAIALLGGIPTQQTPRQLSGLGAPIKWANKAPEMAPFDAMVSSGIISRSEANTYGKLISDVTGWQRSVSGPSEAEIARDNGTATRSPMSITVVDTYKVLANLWTQYVRPMQATYSTNSSAMNSSANYVASISSVNADNILNQNEKTGEVDRSNLLANWIIKHYGRRILGNGYVNSGISPIDWAMFADVPWTPLFKQKPSYEGMNYSQAFTLGVKIGTLAAGAGASGFFGQPVLTAVLSAALIDTIFSADDYGARWRGDWALRVAQNETNTGLWTSVNFSGGNFFSGVTSTEFGRQCMIAYYKAAGRDKSAIIEVLNKKTLSFPLTVGYALALARREALERTGQTGDYEGFTWVPNVNGKEQVPPGTAAYADLFAAAGPNLDKPRWEAVEFSNRIYRGFYKKEPTFHASGWYGRMGYGLGASWYDMAPDDFVKYTKAITNAVIVPDVGVKTPEDARLAGSELPAANAKDRSTWFAILGSKISGLMSGIIDAISGGIDMAVDLLCKVFKWMFGESAGGAICSVVGAILKFIVGALTGGLAALLAIIKAIALFISELSKGEKIKAFKALLLGINQAIFFVIGGPFATMLGGDEMPFLKSQEAKAREKAKAAGLNPDDVVLPSLERLAEAMTGENPFFIFDVIFAVIDIVTSAGALVLKAAGRLVYALCPAMGYLLAPKAMKAIKESKDPDINQWKKLNLEQVRAAVTAITKLVAAVVLGILSIAQAMKMMKDPWKRYVVRKGGTGKAIWSATKNVAGKIDGELLLFLPLFIASAKNGFRSSDPAFIMLKSILESMWKKVPEILLGFIMDELLSEEDRALLQPTIDAIKESYEDAKAAYDELRDVLYPQSEYDVPEDPLPKDPEKRKEELKKRGSKELLPVFALAAGIVVGFMFSGGSDGA